MTIQENIEALKMKYEGKAPLGVCFLSDEKKYVFDAGTNKVVDCSEVEFEIINKLFHNELDEIHELIQEYGMEKVSEAFNNVIDYINEEHILSVTKFKPIVTEPHYREKIENGQQNLTLELTEQCNLRCKYCIYHESFKKDRNFGTKVMTEETAMRAIDCFVSHTGDQDEIAVTFYGGEPLLEFDLMQKCIEYAKKKFIPLGKTLNFSFTTNLTLVTPEIAKYLAEQPNIHIVVSLDGPEEIHDMYRVDMAGNGSFSRAIRGLKYFVEAFKARADQCIEINMVYTPPYSMDKLQRIDEFFDELEWLPKAVSKRLGYVDNGTLPKEIEEKYMGEDFEEDTLMIRAREKVGEEDISRDAIEKAFMRIYTLPVFDEVSEVITMNGCCLPGTRRLYITVDGNFKMCERVGHAPYIGNVNEGINIDVIKEEYLDNYAQKSYEDCSGCWAARLCSVCYSFCYKTGTFSIEDKRNECINVRWDMWHDLCCYYNLLEKDPNKLKFLEDIKIV